MMHSQGYPGRDHTGGVETNDPPLSQASFTMQVTPRAEFMFAQHYPAPHHAPVLFGLEGLCVGRRIRADGGVQQ